MKIDLVIWTLNGEKTLQLVLSRINEIIPKDIVNQKFIVDDGSKDNTISIAAKYDWNVIQNEGKGISDGANTALKHVQTRYFCSFEQDVFLSNDWWRKVSTLILNKDGVAAACGLRFLPKNNFIASIEPYQLTRKDIDFCGGYGKTLDNTIWNSEILRAVGGFPKVSFAGIDTILFHMFDLNGYKWLVDYNVISLHLHYGGLLNEFKHYYFYGLSLPQQPFPELPDGSGRQTPGVDGETGNLRLPRLDHQRQRDGRRRNLPPGALPARSRRTATPRRCKGIHRKKRCRRDGDRG